ncbi:uncharacterized protein LOC112056287 isoform X2 [Bicyclus anynana]|uniref:Uncharacterized protein LOC112056287 isoform X2 n=1 Tax=Bicyclus anynana TaxID=110368 RepID=A0A6J1P4D8_BICAN|nr:uncharacterized protein LOC112056287 isoform X2 [Bicyclus anynana]
MCVRLLPKQNWRFREVRAFLHHIGPYDDTVVIPDDEKIISKYDDIICIIENQISAEPKPQTTQKQEDDIENQIQWSLVGTSKYFEGLLQNDDLLSTKKLDTKHAIKEVKVDDDVVIIDDEEDNIDYYINSNKEPENVKFKDQYSEFLQNYDSSKMWRVKKTGKVDPEKVKGVSKPKQVVAASQKQVAASSQKPSLKQTAATDLATKANTSPTFLLTQPIATTSQFMATSQNTFTPPFLITPLDGQTPQFILPPQNQTTQQNAAAQLLAISTAIVRSIHPDSILMTDNSPPTYLLSNFVTAPSQHLSGTNTDGKTKQRDLTFIDDLPSKTPSLENEDENQFQPVIIKTERVENF